MSYQARKGRGGNVNANDCVKEADVNRLHTVWLQLHDIPEKANHRGSREASGWLPEVEGEEAEHRGPSEQ